MSIKNRFKKNFDLTNLNSFHIGGRAEFFTLAKNRRELVEAARWAKANKLPLLVFGGGSNILISKNKIKGLVLKISGEQYSVKGNRLTVWSGTGLTRLAKISERFGLTGLEWAYGIPGSIGGAVTGNAGAFGVSMSDAVAEVEAYDTAKNKIVKLSNQACRFSYRDSIFKKKRNLLILSVKLKLVKGSPDAIKESSERNFRQRFASKPKEPSAGSVFKNLYYKEVMKRNKRLARELMDKGLVRGGKVPAGYLIDSLGLKGESRGGAKISDKHANFIINRGKAGREDVIKLINFIKMKIKKKYNIELEEEIQYFGS